MKKILLLPAAILIFSCCTSQKASTFAKADVAASSCPKEGECTVELIKNKALNIRVDDLGSTYYQLLESTEKHVIIFNYTKDRDETLQDSGYSEKVIVEIDAANPEMTLSGKALQGANVLFGRFCYCKGATGYYKLQDGNLKITKQNDKLLLTADFKISEVPQIINKIEITVQ